MEYNFQGRTFDYLPVCLDFRNGKLYPNERPGLGVELDPKPLTQIAEITEPVTERAQTYFRPDGSIIIGSSASRFCLGTFGASSIFAAAAIHFEGIIDSSRAQELGTGRITTPIRT